MRRPNERTAEVARFILNGLAATAVHFTVLSVAIQVLLISPAALANFIAAIFGITVSFLGNRYFVFRSHTERIVAQVLRFIGLYVTIAFLHAGLLGIFTDWLGIDFRISFVIATAMQVAVSYLANRRFVFAK